MLSYSLQTILKGQSQEIQRAEEDCVLASLKRRLRFSYSVIVIALGSQNGRNVLRYRIAFCLTRNLNIFGASCRQSKVAMNCRTVQVRWKKGSFQINFYSYSQNLVRLSHFYDSLFQVLPSPTELRRMGSGVSAGQPFLLYCICYARGNQTHDRCVCSLAAQPWSYRTSRC